ncbi:HIS1 [Symbiodinium pilosum]|uniref:ATP phosphoribosyltransferase n=1 Tax=Symbiodinium pilosum TaxID=2952 RepID=A0A812YJ06_SYMPI|nr:HIS1 [Symbiodinium pilosum]
MPLQLLTDVPPLPANYARRAGLSESIAQTNAILPEVFPEGVAYVTVGQTPDVLSLQSTLLRAFGVHDTPGDVSDGSWSGVAILVTTRFADLVQKAELLRLGDLTDTRANWKQPVTAIKSRSHPVSPAAVFTAFSDELAAQEKVWSQMMTQAIEERSAAVRIGFMFSTMPDGRIRLHDLSLEFVKEQAARSGGETALHQVMKILKGAGFDAKRPDRLDVAMCKVFLPAADIPSYVMEGNVDIGISGSDMLEESMIDAGYADAACAPVKVVLKLGIGKCKLCLQAQALVPDVINVGDPSSVHIRLDFVGQRIVTSFPALTKRYFDGLSGEDSARTHIKEVSGSVEAACGLGLADAAVVDLVETGTTMKAAGLDIVSEVLETEALLFQQLPTKANGLSNGSKANMLRLIENRISGYLTATKYVMIVCNCHHDNLAAVCQLLPGKRSPTVTELKEEHWHSVSALVKISDSNRIMDDLAKVGAEDILSLPLGNTRM